VRVRYDITQADIAILRHLRHGPADSPTLAKAAGVQAAGMGGRLVSLRKRGLIDKDLRGLWHLVDDDA
jgi:predicted transcriptional regulator